MSLMQRVRAHPRISAAIVVVVLLIIASAVSSPSTPNPSSAVTPSPTVAAVTTPKPSRTATPALTPTPARSPSSTMTPPAKLTPAILAKVRAILTGNLDSYRVAFLTGVAVVSSTQYTLAEAVAAAAHPAFGTPPYADGFAALSDLAVPGSPAALFSAWQTKVWQPLQRNVSYLAAFEQADAYFTADDEPPAIGTWRDDAIQLDGDIGTWAQTASDWQDSAASSAKLDAATEAVTLDLKAVQRDIDGVAPAP